MPDYILGLDLGQSRDFTALLVFRRSLALNAEGLPRRSHRGDLTFTYLCNHIERFPLGTSYTAIVDSVSRLVARPELRGRPRLGIDATGVGRPVVDMFLDARMDADIHPVTITAGDTPRRDRWRAHSPTLGYWVPKNELVSAVQALLETGRLEVYKNPLAEVFKRELLEFRVKITASANETFEARAGAHDDLVLGGAIAAWLGEQREVTYDPTAEAPGLLEAAAVLRERERERAAFEQEQRDERERLWREAMDPFNPDNDHLWVRLS